MHSSKHRKTKSKMTETLSSNLWHFFIGEKMWLQLVILIYLQAKFKVVSSGNTLGFGGPERHVNLHKQFLNKAFYLDLNKGKRLTCSSPMFCFFMMPKSSDDAKSPDASHYHFPWSFGQICIFRFTWDEVFLKHACLWEKRIT